ncbi:MAG: hypothetical protein LC778_19775 [Acidobacteria bacterium]|nr:hypothetical protein [Acidobacteriota bacterium]
MKDDQDGRVSSENPDIDPDIHITLHMDKSYQKRLYDYAYTRRLSVKEATHRAIECLTKGVKLLSHPPDFPKKKPKKRKKVVE